MDSIKQVNVKTQRWQCSGCDYLCALLLDSRLQPRDVTKCADYKAHLIPCSAWRKVV